MSLINQKTCPRKTKDINPCNAYELKASIEATLASLSAEPQRDYILAPLMQFFMQKEHKPSCLSAAVASSAASPHEDIQPSPVSARLCCGRWR
ncbi:hypothetical protein ATANTOWER_010295 [Ataeniobius toweri]|uniref:Uncharacterized protein n=1 Tax=Ataeniobius toweri TaxID=208326 RepID=A0ABU7APP5_9TELE|nr:hypothetical protein [Ataeniobius toweri]